MLACASLLAHVADAQDDRSAARNRPNGHVTSRDIETGWRVHSTVVPAGQQAVDWLPATVPGVIQTDLLAARKIPDPFTGENEKQLQWIGLSDWEYQTTIQPTAQELHAMHQELVFDGLDTFADVSLNGQPLLHADNMFRTWRLDVTGKLHPGNNTLSIVFHSPVTTMLPVVKAMPLHLPTVSQVIRVSEEGIGLDPYIRKAPYQFGWDWGPRFLTEGAWRPVHLNTWTDARLLDVHIQQRHIAAASADLDAQLAVEASWKEEATLRVTYRALSEPLTSEHVAVKLPVSLSAGLNQISVPFSIRNPQLWFPNGYGSQSRYVFSFHLDTAKGSRLVQEKRTGLRSIELRRTPDQWGRSFTFVVNGIPVFAKGAAIIPFDSFPNRVTPALHRNVLEAAQRANMNMIRAWGGGYYESDEFYDTCDELGLMVWQDFMFGGAFVPGDAAFQHSVEQEAIDNVTRLRDHPSIVLWCGNNETEYFLDAWNKGTREKGKIPQETRERVVDDYHMMFDVTLRSVVEKRAAPVPYWASSPSSGYDLPTDANTNGDAHYWAVWHGSAPVSDFLNQTPRFMSEFGFISFPDMRTLESFAPADQLRFDSPVVEDHQKSVGGNEKVVDYLRKDYGTARDFPSLVYLSQVQQAEAIKVGVEQMRRSQPRTMGSLFWQWNDCWPTISWSAVDSFNRPKALDFYARRFYAPMLVSPVVRKGNLDVVLVSEHATPFSGTLSIELLHPDGSRVTERTAAINVAPRSATSVFSAAVSDLLRGSDPASTFALVELHNGAEVVARNLVFFSSMKDFHLPQAHVQAMIEPGPAGSATVRLSADALARNVRVSFDQADVKLSDNFVDVLPGHPVTLTVASAIPIAVLRSQIKTETLVDALQPTE